MSNKTNDEIIEDIREKREMWCMEHYCETKDIMEDERSQEFIMVDCEEGYERVYLPDELQSKNY